MSKKKGGEIAPKSSIPVKFNVDVDLLLVFDAVCGTQHRTRTAMLSLAMRQTVIDKGKRINEIAAEPLPVFQMLTVKEAREFLRPFYDGKPPSEATIERQIERGYLVAVQDHESRTAPLRILKASLVAWMARLGKKLESEMM